MAEGSKPTSSSSDGKPRGILKRPGEGKGDSEPKGELKMALTEDEEKKYDILSEEVMRLVECKMLQRLLPAHDCPFPIPFLPPSFASSTFPHRPNLLIYMTAL